jgi:hypothetical protein
VLATPLVSPHLYTYDLAILVLPLIVTALAMPEEGTTARRLWLVALGLVFLAAGASTRLAEVIPIQLSSLATFGLLLFLMTSARAIAPAGIRAPTP